MLPWGRYIQRCWDRQIALGFHIPGQTHSRAKPASFSLAPMIMSLIFPNGRARLIEEAAWMITLICGWSVDRVVYMSISTISSSNTVMLVALQSFSASSLWSHCFHFSSRLLFLFLSYVNLLMRNTQKANLQATISADDIYTTDCRGLGNNSVHECSAQESWTTGNQDVLSRILFPHDGKSQIYVSQWMYMCMYVHVVNSDMIYRAGRPFKYSGIRIQDYSILLCASHERLKLVRWIILK